MTQERKEKPDPQMSLKQKAEDCYGAYKAKWQKLPPDELISMAERKEAAGRAGDL